MGEIISIFQNAGFFGSITSGVMTGTTYFICSIFSIVLGAVVGLSYMYKGKFTKSFVVTLALMPVLVQTVIILVNGNLGTGVAVMGAFSLVRFRSVPGTAKEISSIFLAMAIGLATGTGFIGVACVFTFMVVIVSTLYSLINFGDNNYDKRILKIILPEDLNYTEMFDDLFEKYTSFNQQVMVKTTNMGSLYKLQYHVILKDKKAEKEFLDEIRCRNGNLEVSMGMIFVDREEL